MIIYLLYYYIDYLHYNRETHAKYSYAIFWLVLSKVILNIYYAIYIKIYLISFLD